MNDHRQLGRELGLFDSDPLIGAGLPYWLPAGAAIRHAIEEFVREIERRAGYQHVYSPVLGKRELYEISGHWAHYRDDMFPPMNAGGAKLRRDLDGAAQRGGVNACLGGFLDDSTAPRPRRGGPAGTGRP